MSAAAASTSAILRHVPPEILREILVKLPVKSLLRFSTASKSWLSICRMITVSLYDDAASVCRIPLASSMGIGDSTALIWPFEGILRLLRASCDGLWLVGVEAKSGGSKFQAKLKVSYIYGIIPRKGIGNSLFHLSRRQILHSYTDWGTTRRRRIDYKVLKIARDESYDHPIQTEVYSLKSDSWKTISAPPAGVKQERCEYVNGAFHWLPTSSNISIISSFNLSSEEYREIAIPAVALNGKYVDVVVTRGKLCVSANNDVFYPDGFWFALWVMEEYGVEKSWTKMVSIEYNVYNVSTKAFYYPDGSLIPLYFYENGDILFSTSLAGLCIYKNEDAMFNCIDTTCEGFICVETLVSPLPENY